MGKVDGRWRGDAACRATGSALYTIAKGAWDAPEIRSAIDEVRRYHGSDAWEHFDRLMIQMNDAYPTVRIFWKNVQLRWMGCCPRFALDAGGRVVEDIIGLTDSSEGVPFRRQAAKYHRDDRLVLDGGAARLNIVERQDRANGGVVWLRTSKAPILLDGEVFGLIGGYDEVDVKTARELMK